MKAKRRIAIEQISMKLILTPYANKNEVLQNRRKNFETSQKNHIEEGGVPDFFGVPRIVDA